MTDIKPAKTPDSEKPRVPIGSNIAIIVATLVFPIIGIVMGFTFYRKDHPDQKKAGRNWLILGIVVLLINILLIIVLKGQQQNL